MRDHRTLRSPFVVTVLTAASVAACGNAVAPQVCDGPCAEAEAPTGCPANPPTGACDQPGLSCTYNINLHNDLCGVRPHQFSCSSGQWQAGINTCNPPSPMCPPAVPTQGQPCAPLTGIPCRYSVNTPCGVLPVMAICSGTAWQVTQVSCNPPPPDAAPIVDASVDDGG